MDTPVRDYLNEGSTMSPPVLSGALNISPTAGTLNVTALQSFTASLEYQHNQLMYEHLRLQSKFDALVEVVDFMAISQPNLVPRMKAHRHAMDRIEASRPLNPMTTSAP
jgi:hypothetical protein